MAAKTPPWKGSRSSMPKMPLEPRILDGEALAKRLRAEAQAGAGALRAAGGPVSLDAILVGDPAAGRIFTRSQGQRCESVGIRYRLHSLPESTTDQELRALIQQLNQDPEVTGILLNLPLPPHLDTYAAQYYIDPYKDVEGVNPANIGLLFYGSPIIAPCTALAVMEGLRELECPVHGLNAAVVGLGAIAGRPISLFLMQEMATVTACHIATRDLAEHTRQADLIIVAVGKPGLIRAEHVRPGAVVVDVGINSLEGPGGERIIVGDVDYDSVRPLCRAITPVPGGVGPVTVAMLLKSTVEAARKQRMTPRRLET